MSEWRSFIGPVGQSMLSSVVVVVFVAGHARPPGLARGTPLAIPLTTSLVRSTQKLAHLANLRGHLQVASVSRCRFLSIQHRFQARCIARSMCCRRRRDTKRGPKVAWSMITLVALSKSHFKRVGALLVLFGRTPNDHSTVQLAHIRTDSSQNGKRRFDQAPRGTRMEIN